MIDKHLIALISGILLFSASSALAFTPDSGCRVPTAADLKALADRGIPPIAQICPKDELYLGIGKSFEQWYQQLKAQSPCNKNTCTLSCRTRNTGAQVCGPTATRWNSLGCHPNNNTAIFPTVSHGFAAHIELLRRYCGERGRCTISSVVQQWTAIAGDRSAYANFVSKNSGIPANQVFDPNDIDLVSRLAMAMSCYEAGSLPYSVDELKKGLVMAAGGPRVSTPSNVGDLLNESLNGAYVANPNYSPNSHPGSWNYVPSTINGNGNAYTPPSTPVASNTANQNTGEQTTGQDVTATGPLALNLIIWPKSVSRGKSILVIWTSVNASKNSCQIIFQGQQFANTNEGSKVFQTVSSDQGALEFSLECRDSAGKLYQSSDKATIQ